MQLHQLLVICSGRVLCHPKVAQKDLFVLVAQLAPPAAGLLVPKNTPTQVEREVQGAPDSTAQHSRQGDEDM